MVPVFLALVGATPGSCGGSGASAPVARSGEGGGDGSGSTTGPAGGMGAAAAASVRARLRGFEEVPAISTTGGGTFSAVLSDDGLSLAWTLQYADLQGNADGGAVTAAHVHLGQRGVAGGVAVPLCGTGDTAACPDAPATVTGTITAASVTGPTAQGLAAGDLPALLRAMRAGVTYVNVHTTRFPTGEIRGQLRAHRDHPGEDGDDD
jgi:hypothetical protein